jgi:hypothetical protein
LLLAGSSIAQEQPSEQARDYAASAPYSGMYGSMGNVYHPYYRRLHPPPMGGMSPYQPMPGTYGLGNPGYAESPYSGMYGSMGNIYHPYYRNPQAPAMGGMAGEGPAPGAFPGYMGDPYSGMYGSMGNVYHPYYR